MKRIKAAELRINNLLYEINDRVAEEYRRTDSAIIELTEIKKETVRGYWIKCREEGEIERNHTVLEGIPLTEEWLLIFGFKKSERTGRWDNKALELVQNRSGNKILKGFNVYWEGDEILTIEFVHHLQNFQLDFTGEWLIIK